MLATAPVRSIVPLPVVQRGPRWGAAYRHGDFQMSDAPNGVPETDRPALDRRAFLWGTALATAIPIVTEGTLAQARLSAGLGVPPPDAVLINANENPLGPCKAACE